MLLRRGDFLKNVVRIHAAMPTLNPACGYGGSAWLHQKFNVFYCALCGIICEEYGGSEKSDMWDALTPILLFFQNPQAKTTDGLHVSLSTRDAQKPTAHTVPNLTHQKAKRPKSRLRATSINEHFYLYSLWMRDEGCTDFSVSNNYVIPKRNARTGWSVFHPFCQAFCCIFFEASHAVRTFCFVFRTVFASLKQPMKTRFQPRTWIAFPRWTVNMLSMKL